MNPNTKKRVKSLFSMLLALTMMFSSVSVEVFAGGKESGLGDNAAGNNTSGIQTAGGGDFSANITPDEPNNTGKIGVRFSLVNNANPSEVISVDDEGNPRVFDIVFATFDQFLNITQRNQLTALAPENTFSSVKTQELMSVATTGAPGIYRWYYEEVAEYYSDISNITEGGSFSVADMAKHPWLIHINEAYHATGEDFVNWCGTDDSGRKVLTDGGNLSTINVFGVRTQVATAEKDGELTVEVENGLDKTSSTFPADKLDEEIESKLLWLESDIKRMHDSGTEYAREGANEVYEDFVYTDALISALEDKGDASAPSYRTRYETYYNDMEGLFTDFHSGFNSFKVDYVANRCNAAGIYFNPGTGNEALGKLDNYGNENAGTPSEEGTEQSRLSQIHKILALKDKNTGSYILQTKSMIEKNCSIGGATEDWVLLVEPIVYLSICKGNSEGRIKDVVPGTTKLYGTVSNVMDAFMSIPNLRGYANRQTFNYKAMKEWWQALTVRDDTETGGFKFGNGDTLVYPTRYDAVPLAFGSYYHPAVLSNSNRWVEKGDHREKSGWGVNVYWGKNISNPDGRSWDGTSPDPGPPPEPEEEKEGTIKVVKWYTTYYKDGEKTYQIVTNVFVGSKQPRKIFAENEGIPGQGSFYLLEKWATGKDEILPNDNDTDTTFEEYRKKNKGTKGGTGPALITVPDDEKVLYLKLVRYDWAEYEPITVIKVKEPADGSDPIIEKGTTSPGTYPAAETGWEYKQDIQTPDPEKSVSRWSDVPTTGTPGTNPNIPVADTTKTIYIRYTENPPTPSTGARTKTDRSRSLLLLKKGAKKQM